MFTKRRTFLKQAGLAGATLLAAGLSPHRASADPDPSPDAKTPRPASLTSEPEIHSFTFGGTTAHVIHDGSLTLPSIQPAFVPEAKPAEVEELQRHNFLPVDRLSLSINVLVLKTSSGVVLFDSGAGTAFGPIGGRLLRGLAKVGISPTDIKTIFVTHGHSDHIAGLVDSANQLVFTSAKIIAAKKEVDFWVSENPDLSGMRTPEADRAKMHAGIKTVLTAVKPAIELHEPGRISPEVELLDTPGHTPGHAAFRVTIGGESLLVIGDAVHVYSLQFPHPEWSMAFDSNPALAITTRRSLFKKAAAERTLLMAYHLPFPGLGHARAVGSGYEWVPRPWVV
jgi:glyoxylase-like metal-dependent hydrolase (beta-lactamase superfamily II)